MHRGTGRHVVSFLFFSGRARASLRLADERRGDPVSLASPSPSPRLPPPLPWRASWSKLRERGRVPGWVSHVELLPSPPLSQMTDGDCQRHPSGRWASARPQRGFGFGFVWPGLGGGRACSLCPRPRPCFPRAGLLLPLGSAGAMVPSPPCASTHRPQRPVVVGRGGSVRLALTPAGWGMHGGVMWEAGCELCRDVMYVHSTM